MIKQEGESTRQAIRAARRIALDQVKKLASKDAQRQEEKKARFALCATPAIHPYSINSSHALDLRGRKYVIRRSGLILLKPRISIVCLYRCKS